MKLINFLNLCSNLSCFFFYSLFNKKFRKIVIERKLRVISKKEKKTIVNVNSINAKFIEIVYFNNIVAKVNLLRTLYFVACFIV